MTPAFWRALFLFLDLSSWWISVEDASYIIKAKDVSDAVEVGAEFDNDVHVDGEFDNNVDGDFKDEFDDEVDEVDSKFDGEVDMIKSMMDGSIHICDLCTFTVL